MQITDIITANQKLDALDLKNQPDWVRYLISKGINVSREAFK